MRIERKLCISILLSYFLFGCSDKDINNDEFTLYGKLEGSNSEYLIMEYVDINENTIKDTVFLEAGKFVVKGSINKVSKANIYLESTLVDGPNYVQFFIEPSKMSISLIQNRFKKAKIIGSYTQKDHEKLENHLEPYYAKLRPLMERRMNLLKRLNNREKNYRNIQDRLNKIESEREKIVISIMKERLNYAFNHPNSYLSAFWTQWYFAKVPLPTAKAYYDNFELDVKNSLYGIKLKNLIAKRKLTNQGDLAPDFENNDLYGETINLNSFKGKYVLLDFWAGWCIPCRKTNPDLKQLYSTYNSKGLEIISISLDNDKNSWRKAIEEDDIGMWHHIFIGRQSVSIDVQYNVEAIPAYVLIDKNGVIIERYLAANDQLGMKDLKMKLKEIFQ